MKLPGSASHLAARVGLAVGLALLAGVLLTVSIAVSAETARPPAVEAPAEFGVPALAAQAGQTAPVAGAGPSRFAESSKVSATGSANPAETVRRAWQQAREIGVCHSASREHRVALQLGPRSCGKGYRRSEVDGFRHLRGLHTGPIIVSSRLVSKLTH